MNRSTRMALGALALLGLAYGAFLIVGASASSLNLVSAPGALQNSSTELVTANVRDNFTIPGGSPTALTGQITDYDGGTGFTGDAGPTWNGYTRGVASGDWRNSNADYAYRSTGLTFAAASVASLTRQTTAQVVITNVTSSLTNTDVGLVMGSNSVGGTGVVARLWWDTVPNPDTFSLRFYRLNSATTWSTCSALIDTGSTAGTSYTFTMTYAPATPATAATVSVVKAGGGGGTYSTTDTCALSTANGQFTGLYSGRASVARYDDFSTTL